MRSCTCVLAFLLFLWPLWPALAQAPDWSCDGPYGGHVLALALSPDWTVDHTLFAGLASGGLYTSTDAGASWRMVAGLPAYLSVSSLAISPNWASDRILFAATLEEGIFKSTDGGQTWEHASHGLASPNVSQVVISPGFANDQRLLAGTDAGLCLSENGGLSWMLGGPEEAVLAVALAAPTAEGQFALAGTLTGLYGSTDGGRSWQNLREGTPVSAIALSPGYVQDQTLLIGTFGGAWLSSDGGVLWSGPWLEEETILAASFSPHYALDQRLWVSTDQSVYRSDDAGGSWALAEQLNDRIGVLAVRAQGEATLQLWGGGTVSGVLMSEDAGTTWEPTSRGINGLDLRAVAVSPRYLCDGAVFAGGSSGIWMRTANEDWQRAALDGASVAALVCSAGGGDGLTVYAATDAGLYLSRDGGASWEAAVAGLESLDTTSLVVEEQEGVWLGTAEGVYYAPTSTLAWELRSAGMTTLSTRALARLGLGDTRLLLAGTWGGGVFTSRDDGLSWSAAARNPASLQIADLALALGFDGRPVAFAAAADRACRSVDGGREWDAMGLPFSQVLSLAVDPRYPRPPCLYLGTARSGPHLSDNGGLTWRPLGERIVGVDVNDLAVVVVGGAAVVYAATNAGLWRYGEPPPQACRMLALPLLLR